MNLKKYIYSLILSVNIISTASSQVNKNDSLITITSKEADFFIQWRLKAKSLIVDTTIFGQELRAVEGIVKLKSGQITNDSLMFIQKDKVADTWKSSYNDLNLKYGKQAKKTRFFKNTTAIFASTTILLVALFVLVHK